MKPYYKALGLAAELNGLGLIAYYFHTTIADWFQWEAEITLLILILAVFSVWCWRALTFYKD